MPVPASLVFVFCSVVHTRALSLGTYPHVIKVELFYRKLQGCVLGQATSPCISSWVIAGSQGDGGREGHQLQGRNTAPLTHFASSGNLGNRCSTGN